jgi:hypothetical protein
VNFTDPSGYFGISLSGLDPTRGIKKLNQFVDWAGREMDTTLGKQIIAIGITVMTGGAGAGWGMAMMGGFASGYVMTGTLEGAVMGAIFAGASFGIGSYAQGLAEGGMSAFQVGMTRTIMHGAVGGIRARMNGGSFSSGFSSAGLVSAVGDMGGYKMAGITSPAGRIAASAALGGTTSVITGDKFANGAISAAFVQAYNHNQAHGDEMSLEEGLSTMGDDEAFDGYLQKAKDGAEAFRGHFKYSDVHSPTDEALMMHGLDKSIAKGELALAARRPRKMLGDAVNLVEGVAYSRLPNRAGKVPLDVGGAIKGSSKYSQYNLHFHVSPGKRSEVLIYAH